MARPIAQTHHAPGCRSLAGRGPVMPGRSSDATRRHHRRHHRARGAPRSAPRRGRPLSCSAGVNSPLVFLVASALLSSAVGGDTDSETLGEGRALALAFALAFALALPLPSPSLRRGPRGSESARHSWRSSRPGSARLPWWASTRPRRCHPHCRSTPWGAPWSASGWAWVRLDSRGRAGGLAPSGPSCHAQATEPFAGTTTCRLLVGRRSSLPLPVRPPQAPVLACPSPCTVRSQAGSVDLAHRTVGVASIVKPTALNTAAAFLEPEALLQAVAVPPPAAVSVVRDRRDPRRGAHGRRGRDRGRGRPARPPRRLPRRPGQRDGERSPHHLDVVAPLRMSVNRP